MIKTTAPEADRGLLGRANWTRYELLLADQVAMQYAAARLPEHDGDEDEDAGRSMHYVNLRRLEAWKYASMWLFDRRVVLGRQLAMADPRRPDGTDAAGAVHH